MYAIVPSEDNEKWVVYTIPINNIRSKTTKNQSNKREKYSIMKEKWLMVCYDYILDTCLSLSREEADEIFKSRNRYEDWSESYIISEADYIQDKKALLV